MTIPLRRLLVPSGVYDPRYRAVIDRLRIVRQSKGLSQRALANLLDRRQQFVSKYEAGERKLDVVEVFDIAGALEIDPAEIFRDANLIE